MARMRRWVLLASMMVAVGALASTGCEPVKLAHEMPGPPGCGMRNPGDTAPAMLSIAQQKVYKAQGAPGQTQKNEKGGLTWSYEHSRGSVFGEEQVRETFAFDKDGLLYDQNTELLRKVGK